MVALHINLTISSITFQKLETSKKLVVNRNPRIEEDFTQHQKKTAQGKQKYIFRMCNVTLHPYYPYLRIHLIVLHNDFHFSKIKTHLIEDLRSIFLHQSTMDLRRMKIKVKPKFDMTKKIKQNPKYDNVQPQVNTGNNTRKQLEK